jgi:predicted acyltransferase
VAIPYTRLRSAESARSRAYVKVLSLAVGGIGTTAGLGWMLWEARFVIMTVLGGTLLLAGLWAILALRGHSPGCTGLHCPGCRG